MTKFQKHLLVRIVKPPATVQTMNPGVTVYFGRVQGIREIDEEMLYTVVGPIDDDADQRWSGDFKAHELVGLTPLSRGGNQSMKRNVNRSVGSG